MRFLSPLLGILAIVLGVAAASHGPTDIQIGIGCTAILGGLILCVLGAVLSGQARLSKQLKALQPTARPTSVESVRT